jgi:hypothetical protein
MIFNSGAIICSREKYYEIHALNEVKIDTAALLVSKNDRQTRQLLGLGGRLSPGAAMSGSIITSIEFAGISNSPALQ